jgi:hypothetical protein
MSRRIWFSAWTLAAAVLLTTVPLSAKTAGAYIPTMADWLSIQDALHNYHTGLDRHDNNIMASAFTEDGAIIAKGENGVETRLDGRVNIAALGFMGAAPPPQGPPPPPGERWHFTSDDHYVFETPTRATHYGYWMEVLTANDGAKNTQVNVPGHYEDVIVKQTDGRWLLKQRKVVIGSK